LDIGIFTLKNLSDAVTLAYPGKLLHPLFFYPNPLQSLVKL